MKNIVFAFVLLTASLSCKKETKCEKWEYYETCVPKRSGVFCSNNPINQAHFCGDDIPTPGSTKVTLDNENVTITRHFIRKVN